MRVPGWARGRFLPTPLYTAADAGATAPVTFTVNGQAEPAVVDAHGYVRATRMWRAGDVVALDLPMPVRRVRADARAEALRGRVALARGPVLYCLEGVDHPGVPLQEVELPAGAEIRVVAREGVADGVTVLQATGRRTNGEPVELTFMPYYAWNNRGIAELAVWLVEDPAWAAPVKLPDVAPRPNTNG